MNTDSLLYRRQFILGDYPIPDLPEWKSIPFGPYHLKVHPDLETTLAKGSKGEFLLLGFVLNHHRPEASNQELTDEMAGTCHDIEKMLEYCRDLCGRYVIIFNFSGKIGLVNDLIGSRSVYYCIHQNTVWCASQPSTLARILGIDGNYRCNFCDICVPDLRFSSNAAEIPIYERELDEIARSLPAYLETFDIVSLNQVMTRVAEKKGVASLLAQVTHRLEQRYNDPAVLYAAGLLSSHRGDAAEAIRYLRDGFRFALQQGLPEETLSAFYQEGTRVDAKEAFSWLTEDEEAWDSSEGLRCLVQEAFQSLGENSTEFRHLFALWKIRRYGEILEDAGLILQKIEKIRLEALG